MMCESRSDEMMSKRVSGKFFVLGMGVVWCGVGSGGREAALYGWYA